jgi:hypothetical protein
LKTPHARAGIQAPVGPVRETDLAAFSRARLELVRLRARVNSSEDIPKWREAGAQAFILQLLMPHPSRQQITPQSFVDRFTDDVQAFLRHDVGCLEIHDEPNRADRGAGTSWQDGPAFADWFQEAQRLLKARFGDAVSVGFPALAPSTMARPVPSAPIDEETFLAGCQDALAAADWAALHLYWRTVEEMRGFYEAEDRPIPTVPSYVDISRHLGTSVASVMKAIEEAKRVVASA